MKKNQDQLLETPAIVLANLCVSCIMTSLVGWVGPIMGRPNYYSYTLQRAEASLPLLLLARIPLPAHFPPLRKEEMANA